MLRYGEPVAGIMQAGRWKTAQMVARYTAKQGARYSARGAHRRSTGGVLVPFVDSPTNPNQCREAAIPLP